ncbi:MAG TPA: PAS domain-containing protein [Chitinophagaceae bacterium]|nr:PAS domain-containing protein [Chitinophagaceae bacterium]
MTNDTALPSKAFSIDNNLTSLFLQFPAMVAIFEGPALRCTYANPLFLKLYPGREMVGKTAREIVPELEGKGYFEMMEEVYRTGKPAYGYADPATADWNHTGEPATKYFNFVYSPYQVEGVPIGLIAFGLEVTDHVRAQKEAEQRQTFIDTISRAASTGLWVCGPTIECIFVNETWIRWTGRPLEFHLGSGWGNNLLEEDREAAYRAFEHSYETKQPYHHEYRIRSADGTVKWCRSSGGPWYHPDGAFGGFAGSVIDITDRKQEEKRIQSMVEALPLMAWTAKPDGSLDYFNRRWYEYTGQAPEEAAGNGWASTMPPDTEEAVFAKWKYSLEHKVPYEVECKYRRHDGEYRWHIARAEPIKNDAGEVLYWLGTSTDIHDQKSLTDHLERKVQERTNDLISANLALLRSNEELERFASVASHDLKEPLRKIQVFSDLLQQAPSRQPEATIKKIREASNRMMALIDDLLEFSSLNRSQAKEEAVDLNQVLTEIRQDLELALEEKDAVIESDPLPTVTGVPYQLSQLFSNLIGNALKYSKTNEAPRIRITCRQATPQEVAAIPALDSRKNFHLIRFEDNGIGFRPEEAERIFTIFQRLHSKDTYAGTGVGLAVCRKVAQNHAGDIYASGQPGKGASFSVLLPV